MTHDAKAVDQNQRSGWTSVSYEREKGERGLQKVVFFSFLKRVFVSFLISMCGKKFSATRLSPLLQEGDTPSPRSISGTSKAPIQPPPNVPQANGTAPTATQARHRTVTFVDDHPCSPKQTGPLPPILRPSAIPLHATQDVGTPRTTAVPPPQESEPTTGTDRTCRHTCANKRTCSHRCCKSSNGISGPGVLRKLAG